MRLNIYINGKSLHAIPNNSSRTFEIETGTHTLSAAIDWGKSNKLTITVVEGQTLDVEIGSPVDINLNPVSLFLEVAFLFVPIILDIFFELDISLIMVSLICGWLLWTIFLTKKKPLIYYLTFGYKEYLFLRTTT